MSATSGSDATTRSAPNAGNASPRHSDPNPNTRVTRKQASGEAVAVTPDEGGPLQREALVVRPRRAVDVVPLEAESLELRRLPSHERRVSASQVLVAERILGGVEARAAR